jgi:hypothetical protein
MLEQQPDAGAVHAGSGHVNKLLDEASGFSI